MLHIPVPLVVPAVGGYLGILPRSHSKFAFSTSVAKIFHVNYESTATLIHVYISVYCLHCCRLSFRKLLLGGSGTFGDRVLKLTLL